MIEVTLEKVIGKSIVDTNFRAQLLEAPEEALQKLGWVLNEAEMGKLTAGVTTLQQTSNPNNGNPFYEVRGGWWN